MGLTAAQQLANKRYSLSAKGKATKEAWKLKTKYNASRSAYNSDYYKAKEREALLKKKYNISIAQYDAMFKLQQGVCAICGRPPKTIRLAVEHDHASKRVRGLVCHRCNRYYIGNNTAETARKLVAYLESDFDGRNL